jgi:alanyl-tRNA synthetase
MLTGSQIRRKFLDFFVQKGHREVHSSSLVPHNDPTLLFTNAGMNQFKDVFLGLEKRDYTRAATSQKCVRAGGKHNDLENVGFTSRHHTFFEMLGNFSFGDYYKEEAISFAWELLTSPQWFNLPVNKMYFTIFGGATMQANNIIGPDSLARRSWEQVGAPPDRIIAFEGEKGLKENFWQMGETGPCGPCSEIHYDMGPAASDQGHQDCAFGCDCGRYVEIWNLVFMQFDRDASGKLNPLPKPSIDTGAGLERLAAVLQGVISNYETDLFVPLIKRAAELTGHVGPGLRPGQAEQSAASTQAEAGSNVGASTTRVGTGVSPVLAERSSAEISETSGASLRRAGEGTRPYASSATNHVAADALVRQSQHKSAASLRVVADHSRAATFLISDGMLPSNEGRGYVLRKIIRRAITHGRLLGQTKPFLHEMVSAVRDLMGDAYPELRETIDRVSKAVMAEEHRFAHTLDLGLEKLELDLFAAVRNEWKRQQYTLLDLRPGIPPREVLENKDALRDEMRGMGEDRRSKTRGLLAMLKDRGFEVTYGGDKAFKLYDTYGMPLDFIQDTCRDQGINFDQEGFDRAMAEQRERTRASWKGAAKQTASPAYQQLPKSVFEGYLQTRSEDCEVLAIIKNGQGVQELKPGEEGEVILDHTPFYAESGGQVGDRGVLYSDELNAVVAEVKGCYYPVQGVRAHQVVVKSPPYENRVGWGTLKVGDKVDAVVDTSIREATMRNHTATHLLHAGVREVLGKHVKQAGSLVAPNHLRFDFSHFTALEDEELQDIEDLINKEVLRNRRVEVIENVPIDVAVNEYKAMALFGEKYGDRVRVIKIGDFSTELCGGTHTGATGEIGLIKILKEGSVSSGVRRVEAVTGEGSLQHFRKDHQLENVVAELTGRDASPQALKAELEKKEAENKRLQRELDQARMKSASSSVASVGEKIKEVGGVKVLAHRVDNLERPQMRTLVDQLRDKIGSGVVVLGSATNGNVALIVGVTKDLTSRIQAGKVIGPVAQKVGGKGGGRPDLAEAGGKDPEALDAALGEAYGVVEGLLVGR